MLCCLQKKYFDRNGAMADPLTGQKPPPKTIITEGDRKNNTINALSDIGLVTSQLTTTIAHLKEFVGAELERGGGVKNVILRQIRLVERASEVISTKVAYVATQTGVQTITRRQEQRKRADVNYNNKMESKLKKTKHNNYIKLEDNIFAKLVSEGDGIFILNEVYILLR